MEEKQSLHKEQRTDQNPPAKIQAKRRVAISSQQREQRVLTPKHSIAEIEKENVQSSSYGISNPVPAHFGTPTQPAANVQRSSLYGINNPAPFHFEVQPQSAVNVLPSLTVSDNTLLLPPVSTPDPSAVETEKETAQSSSYGLSSLVPFHFEMQSQPAVDVQPSLTMSASTTPLPPIVMPDEKTLTSKEPNPLRCDPNNVFFKSLYGVDRLPVGGIRFGRSLGSGAFGQVYQGQWGKHHVALKVIDREQAQKKLYGAFEEHEASTLEQLSEALQWEVLSLSSVSHPNLVTFYGIYQHQSEGATYLVMEYCAGGTLQHILKHSVPWSKRWQWALEITQGLAAIHEQGLLHRDLKAENVLLDHRYCAKLGDLSVAQMDALLQDSEAEVVAKGLHDNRFIAPENIQNPTLSNPATDIYALGLVFWQMMTGKIPRRLDEFSPQEGQAWLAGGDREVIPENTPEEKSFAKLIRWCWQKDSEKRPTAVVLIQALQDIGEQFHPQAPWVILAETIDAQLHTQRKAGQAYQSPYATQQFPLKG